MLYWDGADWVLFSAGAEGEVATAHGAAAPTWETPAASAPKLYTKREQQAIVPGGGANLSQAPGGSWSGVGTQTSGDDAVALFNNMELAAATAGTAAGVISNYNIWCRGYDPEMIVKMKTAGVITVLRFWIGMFSAEPKAISSPTAIHCAAFRYDTGVPDPNWVTVTSDDSVAPLVTNTGIAVAINTIYNMRIECDPTTPSIKFYINEALVATHTGETLPTAAQLLGGAVEVTSLEAVKKSIRWSRIAILHN
jgi:hypothetical protein